MTSRVLAAFTLLWCVSVELSGDAAQSAGQDRSLIGRFLRHDAETALRSYRATRRLEAKNDRFNSTGWLEATTELTADRQFRWTVVREGGSSRIRNTVLRKTLEGEADAVASPKRGSSGLTEANYTFAAEDIAEDGLARIRIVPRRRDGMLINGHILLTRPEGDLVRVEGRLAKNPSFWTTRVEVVRRYARINGVRVPIAMESVAHVRIAGRSTFVMRYTYSAINDAPVPVNSQE
jgi:hypothetical protein